MANKKYATFSDPKTENPTYECVKRKCKWQGKENEKEKVRTDPVYLMFKIVCPKCGHDEFYTLLEQPINP